MPTLTLLPLLLTAGVLVLVLLRPCVRIGPSVPLAVHHGGSGTVMTALAHGLPMVIMLISADQPDNALRCEQLGVAKVVSSHDRTPEVIRESVRAVLHTSQYRHNAERLREEMDALPATEQTVEWLEWLAAERQPLAAAL